MTRSVLFYTEEKPAKLLTKKYGQGTLFTEVCSRCGYEDESLHSEGVHESQSGSLRVYSEDEKFKCPICPDLLDEDESDDQENQQVDNESSGVPVDPKSDCTENAECEKKVPKQKQKKKSSFEKGIEVVCEKFNSSCKNEMEWFMKIEDERHKREMKTLLKQTQLENERRKEERENEL